VVRRSNGPTGPIVRRFKLALVGLLAFVALCFVLNTNLFSSAAPGRPMLLAHRGLAQTFDLAGVQADTCTASRIHPPEHPYLENTLASMAAAFAAGADMVELDIHPTTDGQFAVFHDWTLDCRTDGKGVTREHALADLKKLDVGYGYTADGGKTFPFRGTGVGAMPSLDEALAAFPHKRILIHIKSNDPTEGEKLAARLAALAPAARDVLAVYGGRLPVAVVRERLPDLMTMSARAEMRCLGTYLAVGWSGYVPHSCANMLLLVPRNYASWLWGWPDRFIARMRAVSAEVVLLGPRGGDEFSSGIDTAEELARLPRRAGLGIWTNRIDRIAPLAGR
jgi:glycerophosphoryl diester phosphodiesterase